MRPFYDLRTDGLDVLRDEGILKFVQRGTSYLGRFLYRQSIGRTGDYLVRRLLDDPYTLPIHLRRDPDYLRNRTRFLRLYSAIRAHTGIPHYRDSTNSDGASPRIADIGCGDGSLAVAFHEQGPVDRYVGLDVNERRIKSLNRRFNSTNYEFVSVDVRNRHYNPQGKVDPERFEFPFQDDAFDLVILRSVFTHLLPESTRNYLEEIDRVLAEGGSIWSTWTLITSDSDLEVETKRYEYDFGGYYSQFETIPERSLAYPYDSIEGFLQGTRLEISKHVPGYWRDPSLAGDVERLDQDVLVFEQED